MMLALAHIGLAQLLSAPEIVLSPAESDAYSKATIEFMRWHLPNFAASGKRGSEWGLAFVMLGIYLPKVFGVAMRRRAEQARPINPVSTDG